MNELSLATLTELARAGSIRHYTLTGQAGGWVLTVRYGMTEAVHVVKRGGPRLFARIETAFELLRTLGASSAEVHFSNYERHPRPYRKGRPEALKALNRIKRRERAADSKNGTRRSRSILPSDQAQMKLPGLPRRITQRGMR